MARFLRMCALLCAALLLCACAAPGGQGSSAPGTPPGQGVGGITVPPHGGEDDAREGEAENSLPPPDFEGVTPAGLAEAAESYWFGRQLDESNTPVRAKEAQEEYGGLGLVALGPKENCVYLTFDFGYETGYSGAILDALLAKEATASFFLTQNYVQDCPEAVARMVGEGHAVGGHSITHPGAPKGLAGYAAEKQVQEIAAVAQSLLAEYGYQSRLFRFPEGIYSPAALARAAGLGQYSVFWSVAYGDFDPENQEEEKDALREALAAAHPGAVYLLHPQSTNAAILPALIDGLREQGYEVCAL